MRPSKLTKRRQDRICDALRGGHSHAVAARIGGISLKTFNRWISRSRDPEETDPRYSRFGAAVLVAELEAEETITGHLIAATEKNWRAAAWWLERRFPERWGRPREDDAAPERALEVVVRIGGKVPSNAESGHNGHNALAE